MMIVTDKLWTPKQTLNMREKLDAINEFLVTSGLENSRFEKFLTIKLTLSQFYLYRTSWITLPVAFPTASVSIMF